MRSVVQRAFLAFRNSPHLDLATAKACEIASAQIDWTGNGWRVRFRNRQGTSTPSVGILIQGSKETRAEDLQIILTTLFEGGWWMTFGEGHDPRQLTFSFLAGEDRPKGTIVPPVVSVPAFLAPTLPAETSDELEDNPDEAVPCDESDEADAATTVVTF